MQGGSILDCDEKSLLFIRKQDQLMCQISWAYCAMARSAAKKPLSAVFMMESLPISEGSAMRS